MPVIDKVVTCGGDLSKLTSDERATYYKEVCESVGLNPLTEPFKYITLNGKLQFYTTKAATEQLRKINGISLTIVSTETVSDVYIVRVRATDKDGRVDESTGAVSIAGLKGDALANAIMKCETKGKRRVTLSISGLGFLDETEIETIPGAVVGPDITFPETPDKSDVKTDSPASDESPKESEKPSETSDTPPDTSSDTSEKEASGGPSADTGEILSFNVIVMGNPRKKNGKEEYGVPAVIAEPAEYEGEVELISPAQYKELLVNGAALEISGALSGKSLLASSVKPINIEESEKAETEVDIAGPLAIGQQGIVKLTGDAKLGKLPLKGEVTESYFGYAAGRTNTILFGDSLKGFVSDDIIKINVEDIIEKDGKMLVVVSACEKSEAVAS